MSRTVQVIASRVLLSITLIFALTQMHVFAQNYTWRNVQIVGGGFIVGVVFNQTEPNLVYTRTDIGGAYRLDNATSRWVPLLDSISWLDYAELTPAYIVRAANGDTVNCEKSLAISTDGGTTWAAVSSQPSGLTGGGSVAVSATGAGKIVWSPAGVGVFFMTGGGKTWTASTGIPAGARVASDRVNSNKFYGFKSGTFYVSTDGGKTFAARAGGLPLGGPVRFKAVPGREDDIWLAGGAEWGRAGETAITGDPRIFGRVYIGRGVIYGDGQ